jgi:glycosyltransferase involved in cell wall biosynthesis
MFTHHTSLIIPTRNRSVKLIKLIKDIRKNRINFNEIIIVDSSDIWHKNKIKKFFDKKKIKLINTYPSTTHQRNIGLKIKKKNSKFILFLDDDIKLNKKSFFEMNNAIKKYENDIKICSFGFNLKTSINNFKFEKIKKSKIIRLFGLYDSAPGKVLDSGWHTKISNLKEDTFVEWLYSGATIYKANIVKKIKFNNLNKGFNYLEDLYFSYNLTKKKFKHIVIAKATVINSHVVSRENFSFGFIEIMNRYKFVKKFHLNKKKFYFSGFVRSIFSLINLYNFKSIARFLGNIKGMLHCIYFDLKKF